MSSGRTFFGALYAWLAAVFFGAVLLDVISATLPGETGGAFTGSVSSEISDFLLLLGAPVLVAAIAAVAFNWDRAISRNLFLISLLLLSLEFIIPALLLPLLQSGLIASMISYLPYLRLASLGLASILAMAAWRA